MKLFKRGRTRTEPLAESPRVTHSRSSPVTLEVKLLALEALASGLRRKDVAEVIGVSAVTLGSWQKLYDESGLPGLYGKPSSATQRQRCKVLQERILEHRRAYPEHGVRRISDELRRQEGLQVSPETVRTVVNEAGMAHPAPTPARGAPAVRRFERTLPNALWQIDIFTFELKRMYRVYLVGILDDHSRYVVGWGLFRQQTADAVLEVLKGAIGQWGAPREILSDNGRQFVSWRGRSRFQEVLRQQGVGHVRSAPHHPMTLGKIERFWKTIWREFLSEAVFASFADACQRLDHWVQYYNHQRPHQGIDGACPADRFYGVAHDVQEAIRQGCQENARKLALGQAPQSPLYLLGKLGGTDVRVVRKGDELEVRVGETVRETIRLGRPYTIDEEDRDGRESGEMESDVGRGSVESAGAGAAESDGDRGSVPAIRDQPADPVPGALDRRTSSDGSVGPASAWPPSQADQHPTGAEPAAAGPCPAEGTRSFASEVRGDADAADARAQADRGPGPDEGSGGKSRDELPLNGYVGSYGAWPGADTGATR